jgi:hypothetical protein
MDGRRIFAAVLAMGMAAGVAGCEPLFEPARPVGLMQLIEFEEIQGIRNWEFELDRRGLTALVFVQANILQEYPDDFARLAAKGYEIAGGYAAEAFWDVPYENQVATMSETKTLVEQITGKPMRVFGSRYFAYDENTLRAADELGIEYILARGTSDVEALIYHPEEYDVKIISVSNVPFGDMGRGSLCDYSLWARGATAEDFDAIAQDALDKQPERIMVVSHAYIGGIKEVWWQAYAKLLDSPEVVWAAGFDEWVSANSGVNISVPLNLVPVNREVQYFEPTPSQPLEDLEDVQDQNPCGCGG